MRRKNTTSEMMESYIVESLLRLMREKNFENITVAEISTLAGVDRSTYYRHFESKEQVLQVYYEELLSRFVDHAPQPETVTLEEYARLLFVRLQESREDLLCIHRAGKSWILLQAINHCFVQGVFKGRCEALRVYYHAGGIFNCCQYWLDGGMRIAPEELACLAVALLPKNFRPMISRPDTLVK